MSDSIDIGELFQENSKLLTTDTELFAWMSFVAEQGAFDNLLRRPFKNYRGKPKIALPADGREVEPPGFDEIVAARRSVRQFEGAARLPQVARMLSGSYGLPDPGKITRPVPSAGALYPLEIYLASFDIEGLDAGLYHFAPNKSCLEQLETGDVRGDFSQVTMAHDVLDGAAGLFVLTGMFPRTQLKYRKRAFRFVYLEAGHLAQNLMLHAVADGLGTVALGGFLDDEINRRLGVDGLSEACVYLVAFGVPRAPA